MGKTYETNVRLGDVVSTRQIIPPRSGISYDPLPEVAKWSLLASLCQAISCLHELHLIHADISGRNVYIRWANSSDPKAYVIDAFNGLSDTGGNPEVGAMRSDVCCPVSLRKARYTSATDVYCMAWWITHIALAKNPYAMEYALPNLRDVEENNAVIYNRHEYAKEGLGDSKDALPKWLWEILVSAIREAPDNRPSSRELTYAVHDHWVNFGDRR